MKHAELSPLKRKDLSPLNRWTDDWEGRRYGDPEYVLAHTLGASRVRKLVARLTVVVAAYLDQNHWANEEVSR